MSKGKWECLMSKEFDGDIVITDPCYVLAHVDCDGGEIYGGRGMASSTYYGDWGCTLFRTENDVGRVGKGSPALGRFCADGGMVCVAYVEDARESFNSMKNGCSFDKWLEERPWCATVVKGFKGKVSFMLRRGTFTYKGVKYDNSELRVRGDGEAGGKPFLFESVQTSA